MRVALPIASLVLAGTLAACGGESPSDSAPSAGATVPAPATPASAAPSSTPPPPVPTYKVLTEAALKKALLGLDELPPGYSQDPPDEDDENKNFCDYKAPAVEKVRVGRDFTKGGGMSAEFISIKLRQFKSTEAAKAAWKAMTRALRSCKGEVYDGTKLTYSRMSAPKLGDAAMGVKIDADGVTLVQNFVLVGPVMISAGGGGLTNTDADAVSSALKAQVKSYIQAARN
jgi:hypothetical protein